MLIFPLSVGVHTTGQPGWGLSLQSHSFQFSYKPTISIIWLVSSDQLGKFCLLGYSEKCSLKHFLFSIFCSKKPKQNNTLFMDSKLWGNYTEDQGLIQMTYSNYLWIAMSVWQLWREPHFSLPHVTRVQRLLQSRHWLYHPNQLSLDCKEVLNLNSRLI